MKKVELSLDDKTMELVEWAAEEDGETPERWMVEAIEAWLGEDNTERRRERTEAYKVIQKDAADGKLS